MTQEQLNELISLRNTIKGLEQVSEYVNPIHFKTLEIRVGNSSLGYCTIPKYITEACLKFMHEKILNERMKNMARFSSIKISEKAELSQ